MNRTLLIPSILILLSLFPAAGCTTPIPDSVLLIQGEGLDGWRKGPDLPADDWIQGGQARPAAGDPTKLELLPGRGVLVNGREGRTRDLLSQRLFGDVEAHIEFMVPQGSNSGVYFMGRYEIQVLDSFGKDRPEFSNCGGIYQRWDPKRGPGHEGYEGRPPRINAALAPGEWQTFDVTFRAPRFDARGMKRSNACFVKVIHNGELIHEDQEVTGPTRAAAFGDEQAMGPLMLQGDHGPVAYRNIRITPLPSSLP